MQIRLKKKGRDYVRIECEWSNETNARRYHSSHTQEMLFWQMRVFLNAIKSFAHGSR